MNGVGCEIQVQGHVAAAGGKPVLVKEIARAADIPGPRLATIVDALAKRGVLFTQRGSAAA